MITHDLNLKSLSLLQHSVVSLVISNYYSATVYHGVEIGSDDEQQRKISTDRVKSVVLSCIVIQKV